MSGSNLKIWVIVFGVSCLGICQGVFGFQDDEEDRDELGHMSAHDFSEVDICEEPPPPMNGELHCSKHKKKRDKYVCKAECEQGFQFPNGKMKGRHFCDLPTGKWSPSFVFPDCIPMCNPPCENGGECLDGNHCLCTPSYRGDKCQYELSVCVPENGLSVSGDWTCNHTQLDSSCVLRCPEGTRFESQPAEVYKCSLEGIWTPDKTPTCVPINIIEPPAIHGFHAPTKGVTVKSNVPTSGVCATWSAFHYRTFDGGIYSFQGACAYLLAKDCLEDTFSIHVSNTQPCYSVSSCPTTITVYIGSDMYLMRNGDDGPFIKHEGQIHPIPSSINGLLFQMLSDYVTVTSTLGFKLKWNRKNTILLEINNQLKNKTCGLCGKFDGTVLNDLETSDGVITDNVERFVNSWAMEYLGDKCEGGASVRDFCGENEVAAQEATQKCYVIFHDKFSICHQLVDPKAYFEACRMDHCSCGSTSESCGCSSLAEYFGECIRLGGRVEGGWRDENLCPLSCPEGMVYADCGSSCPKTCRGTTYDCEDNHCMDGCHCPEGTVLHEGRCLIRQECPCMHNGVEHLTGERILQDCNACECLGGKWHCTEETCDARCSSTGDPHYVTFDGTTYEFLGSCSYYLVYNDNFTVVQETGPCPADSGTDSAADASFCTMSVKIEFAGNVLLLQPGIQVTFNSKSMDLPLSDRGFKVAMATDLFLQAKLENGLSLLWDGHNRIYVDASPSLFGQTIGLCGTFNRVQNDDFLTPEHDVEADVETFAARWQASDSCHKRGRRSFQSPCEMQPQKLTDAEALCSAIKSDTFSACHGEVDPYPYFRGCVNDLCLCGERLDDCLCPIIADYSQACARKGIVLDNWVEDINACKPDCPLGQVYKECGNPCTCTCFLITSNEDCTPLCVQGCTCPDGMTLDNLGLCIPIDQCPCSYEGKDFQFADITVQGTDICTCATRWQCRPGTHEELVKLKPVSLIQDNRQIQVTCSEENNEEFTECIESCPKTCQNAHLPPKCTTEECTPGCRCKEGFILDTDLQKCVEMKDCGCVHANQRYKEEDSIKQSCNLCTCRSGVWRCTEKVCPGVCTSWGEHYKTYDGKIFDFVGDCEYVLSKGKVKSASYTLSVKNLPCGSGGVTCSKSFTLDLGAIQQRNTAKAEERLTLTKDDALPAVSLASRFVVLESGLFVLVYTDIGVTLRWDRGTRLYITLDPQWRNKVKGLCGNFNDDQSDDFLTPFGGISEARAAVFADSWKVHEFCSQAQEGQDTCALNPQRKAWAQKKCGILKEELFARCRSTVAVEPFYERCVFDACACDMGGDCDCLCTAIATYAQECSINGVSVKWRSQELCPIQCEECATYESCMPSCPKKTCENEYRFSRIEESCSSDFCVEGCEPKPCPEGQIFNSGKDYTCIPKSNCVVPCLEINGVVHNEGDRVTDVDVADPCQSCHCHKGSVTCAGSPCVKFEPHRPCLKSDWTPWMNTPSGVGGDREDLSDPVLKTIYENYCGIANVTDIQCRMVESKIQSTESRQIVTCELPRGLTCNDAEQVERICEDYEIRVLCDCGPMFEPTTVAAPTTPVKLQRMISVCDRTGWTTWMSNHLPTAEGEIETLDMLRRNHIFCADDQVDNIECRTTLPRKEAMEYGDKVICNKKLGLLCRGPDCDNYEVRVYCNCGAEETTPSLPSCVTGWTEFFNTDHPTFSDTGDDESIERIREKHTLCESGTLEAIECKANINGELVDYTSMDPFGLKCSKNVGFICNKYVRTDNCPDFMVRFYCVCEQAAETTKAILEATTTPLPITPVPVECGWTRWLNIDTPDSGEEDDGDVEDLAKIQLLYKTCGGKDLVDIECRMSRTLHTYSESLQQNLQCDTQHGFSCKNSDQIGNCYDYEVRLLCMYDWCYPPTTTPMPTTTTKNPCPDGQVYDACAYKCDQMCSAFFYEIHEQCSVAEDGCIATCRPSHGCSEPNWWRDHHTCVPQEQCTCILIEGQKATVVAPTEVIVRGCEKCQCVHDMLECYTLPGCGTTPQPAIPRLLIKENITRSDCWTEWVNVDRPTTGGGDLETMAKIRQQFDFCQDPIKIECRTVEGHKRPFEVGQKTECNLLTGLTCWNTDNDPEKCHDYEVRFFCPCPTTPLPPTEPPPTLPPGICIHGWTSWYNTHPPEYHGDHESIQSARVDHVFCANEMISAVECARAGTNAGGVLQRGVHCDLHTGLLCNQENLGDSEACWDYEIRFFCDCPTLAPVTELQTPSSTTEFYPKSCDYWSDWINEHHPTKLDEGGTKKGVKGGGAIIRGDTEKAMPLKLQREQNFCLDGSITNIGCRVADTDLDYTDSGDNKLTCTLAGGFRCRGKDQPGKMCKDYKIRYFCSCKENTTPLLTKPTTSPIHIEPCSSYDLIIDGPMPLMGNVFKASSSKNEKSGPENARFSTIPSDKTVGAWIAGDVSTPQFLEMDLGHVHSVYGIVTKGRGGHGEWIKSYNVLYSRDGVAYEYMTENGNNPTVFSGNSDGHTAMEHVFRTHPFEARFVRIQPLTFHKEMALRVDLLGCAEGKSTPPIFTTLPPQCSDNMGLSNGLVSDAQILTSSDRNPNSDGRYVRLHMPQTEEHSGGWVAAELDYQQFVKIDFVEPRVLTGVKIQGRDQVPQWVTAFDVYYSQDDHLWHELKDPRGLETKVFSGSYDSDSVVAVYFPQAVRARFIKIHPLSWQNWIAMRLEILGCYEPLQEEVKDEIHTTPKPYMLEVCTDPMGFENHQLPNTLIYVSSFYGLGSDASRIRLNTPSNERGTGGWIAHQSDYKPVIVIDFSGERNITGIITQGLEDFDKWVMSYYVKYSLDNVTWDIAYDKETGNYVFPGNFDRNTPVLRLFTTILFTRYLKVIIVDYHIGPALRMEVLGCFIPYPEITPPPPTLIPTTEFCAEYGPWLSLSDPASQTQGDVEPIDKIISASGMCSNPYELQCRSLVTGKDYSETGQIVTCNLDKGLLCLNHEQSSYMCYNYEVRIKCWTCGIETTAPPLPLEMCPEVPYSMKGHCPVSCPADHACDGDICVSRIDCPCFRDGRRFEPSNQLVTQDCQKCECILGGHSTCKPIQCPACLPGQKSQMTAHCSCACVGCEVGTALCPSSGECLDETKWCDGVVDCTDDEIGCPTTPAPTTVTVAPTTEMPLFCSTDSIADSDTCEMTANMFETFDGLTYQYDICDHVLMVEKNSNLYSVTVHKSCSPMSGQSCQRYLVIEVDGVMVKVGPGPSDVTVQDVRVAPSNLWAVSQRFKYFELRRKGNAVLFRSKKYHFDVVWDTLQDARIVVSRCLHSQTVGLCGLYNNNRADDRTTPGGNLVKSNQEFGDSWSLGSLDRCAPQACPEHMMRNAIDTCTRLQEEPFNSSCASHLKMESRVEACIVFMCECIQRTSLDSRKQVASSDVFYDIYDTGSCRCQAFESFVDACEIFKQEPVKEWRIQYGCTPECPPGMEWQDCGPGCELTCDNYHERDTLCEGGCTPGCYCPTGMIRHKEKCVKPMMCQDCVCRGHGDPNYITFDGRYYAFQGNCTYILAQHQVSEDPNMNFKILATNVECPEEPHTSCTAGLQIFWNGHNIEKFKNKPVYVDGEPLKAEDSPFDRDGISVTFVPGKSTVVHVKPINLAVRYFDQMYGFNIELPAFFYFNKTEGLCGVCNFIQSDDLYHQSGFVTEDIEDFAYSWLVGPDTRPHCEFPKVAVEEPPPPGICNFTASPCEVFLDPSLYSQSCQNDITYSHRPEASVCRSKFQYAQQCCEKGVSLVEWLKTSGCESSCPQGMFFECTSACQKTCENYKSFKEEDCSLLPLYTCRCPDSQVMKLGTCSDASVCETCDYFGHVVGDVWGKGLCELCECMSDLSTRCTVTRCPEPPICEEKHTLEKLERHANACCDVFQCVEIAKLSCPDAKPKECNKGEANVLVHNEGCPEYHCECMPDLCPPLVEPFLDEGESTSIEREGCCPLYRTECDSERCPPTPLCGPGFRLSTHESPCCLKYACVQKKNICVYRYKYGVVDGEQTELEPLRALEDEFEAGSSWQDGLCRKCSCLEIEGQHAFSCQEEICPDPAEFPDAEKYVREEIRFPGACCPKYRRTACKVNGVIYAVGVEWPSPSGDPCKSYKCVEDKGEAAILEKSTFCDKYCPGYAVYVEAAAESNKCCGECKAVACEENGILYQDKATWTSTTKPCYTAECSVTPNGTHIVYRGQSCPSMPGNCPKENVKTDPKGCCTYCKQSTENCAAVQVPLYETRGFFGYVDKVKGVCSNEDALENLTKCGGQCETESQHSNLLGDFESVCHCCLPRQIEDRPVILSCEDGSRVEKVYQQPLACSCSSCSGTDRSLEAMNRMEPY